MDDVHCAEINSYKTKLSELIQGGNYSFLTSVKTNYTSQVITLIWNTRL